MNNSFQINESLSLEEQKKETVRELISHLMEVGWLVNHEYLEYQVKYEYKDYDKNEQDFLARLIWGRLHKDYFLISNCKRYVAKINHLYAYFYEHVPGGSWDNFAKWKINDIKLMEKGIKYKGLKFILDNPCHKEKTDEWSNLSIYRGHYGWQTRVPEKKKF